MVKCRLLGMTALALVVPGAAFAQDAAPAPAQPAGATPPVTAPATADNMDEPETSGVDQSGQLVVVATRIKGQVVADQPPLVTMDEEDIAAYGVGSIQELLTVLAPQTGSGRGRGSGGPVILLNGMRISDFREMRGLPPEAIRRVEILPEEVALKYGYRPDQRVVNFILKDKYRSFGSETDYNVPGRGGTASFQEEATLARIAGQARLNVTATLKDTSPLTEAERGIYLVTPQAGDPDPADFRTLVADSKSAALNATWARGLGGGAGLSVNGLFQRDNSRSLNGLNGVALTDGGATIQRYTLTPEPITTRTQTTTVQGGVALNKPISGWLLAITGNGSHIETENTIDSRADLSGLQALVDAGTISAAGALPDSAILPVAANRALTKTDSLTTLATMSGQVLRLPGGEVSFTGKAGFSYSGISGTDTRTVVNSPTSLKRGDTQAGFSLDLPITSRRENFGAKAGDISLNVNAEIHHLSDFGSLTNYGGGLTWKPTEKLALTATYISAEAAPGLTSLGGATTITTGVSLYDFSLGQTVLATVISGGNPNLRKEHQRDIKLGLNWTLPFLSNSSFILEYFDNHSTNTTNAFPLLTPEVEAAFPGRVVRDAVTGRILSVDQSPVTFADQTSSRIRYGFNLSGSFGKPDPNARRGGRFGGAAFGGPPPGGPSPGGAGAGAGGPPPPPSGGMGPPPGGGGRFGRGNDGRGRWNLSITHTIQFTNRIQIAPGTQVLDLLDGTALTGGGEPRHSIQFEGGGFYRGFGLRTTGTYVSGTHVNASGLPGSTRLDFAPIAKVNIRMFADVGRMPRLVEKIPFLKQSRFSLGIDNLFDAIQRVTDSNGQTPVRYLPGYVDPLGRTFKLEFRKQF